MRKPLIQYIIGATNSVGELFGWYAGLVASSSIGFAIFEHKSLSDGLWWAIVTSTTTGYGDLSPATLGGRIIGALLMLTSVFLILPLLISYIAKHMLDDPDAWTNEEQEQLKRDVSALRAELTSLREDRQAST